MGLGKRRAAFRKYAQAVPGAFAIEKRGISPCKAACPAHISVQGYVALAAQGKYREALKLIKEENPLPAICGRVCHHPCESACLRGGLDEPVAIDSIKRFLAYLDLNSETRFVPQIKEKRNEKVAIIGSGPAGLSCAYYLAAEGYGVTVFEKLPVLGGMLTVGIPSYRLPKEIINAEIQVMRDMGVEFKTGVEIGRDFTISQLRKQGYKAFFIGIGAQECKILRIPGEELKGVVPGVEYLREINLGREIPLGDHVAVVGGGNVAMDTVRSALRNGATKPFIIYRRSEKEMPASKEEIRECCEEGIEIMTLTNPKRIIGENGRVKAVECVRMELGEPDSSGRRRPVAIPGSEFIIEVDTVVPAIGQESDWACLTEECACRLTDWGTMVVDSLTCQTHDEDIFAGGDAVTGPETVIEAIAAGKRAAISIGRYIRGEDLKAGREKKWDAVQEVSTERCDRMPRERMAVISPEVRTGNFEEVQLGFTEEQVKAEAVRCLSCGICSECYQCVEVCLAEAVNHDEKQIERQIQVGAVITSTGFKPIDPSSLDIYAYGRSPNVLTSIEFERMLSPGGPFKGHIVRRSDGKEPSKIAWIQCVGSRSEQEGSKPYCSNFCCMASLKQTMIAKEHIGPHLDTAVFFMDMRTPRKDFEKYFEKAKDLGGRLIRSRVHSILPQNGTGNLYIHYVTEEGHSKGEIFDMVVLSVGLMISDETRELARKLDIRLGPNGFIDASCFEPVSTSRAGVYACGVLTGPKDIPQTVMEGSAAAMQATRHLFEARGSLLKKKSYPPEKEVAGQTPRIGIFVCNCGLNIGGVADVPALVDYARSIPNVEYVQENLFTCSEDSQRKMAAKIEEYDLNRVVVAACSPSTHQPIFQDMLRNVGLNKYLFEMANIRNQCTWVHPENPEMATAKCKDLIRMAAAKARLIEPLDYITIDINRRALVIGGGIAGMTSALALADQGYYVHLVERKDRLGGNAIKLHTSWRHERIRPFVYETIAKVENHQRIGLHFESIVVGVEGTVGKYKTTLSSGVEIEHGIVVIAIGAEPLRPEGQYLYKRHPNVLLSLDLDRELARESRRVKNAQAVAFIQCVGSRIPERPYCNKICCAHAVENALRLKEMNPDIDVYILFRDMRTYGERESIYTEARRKGILFFRYGLDDLPKVDYFGDRLKITVTDHVLQRPVELVVDILTLATAIIPHRNAPLAELYKIPLNAEGFFTEAHAKMRPVDSSTEGIFMAGLCHYPKPIQESVAEALAAASRANTILSKTRLELESIISHPIDANCDGCAYCVDICPFKAITLIEYMKGGSLKKSVEVEESKCKGCGSCMATCPKNGIYVAGFTLEQLGAQASAALGLL